MISHLEDMNYIENTLNYSFFDDILIIILYLFYFLNIIIFYLIDFININKVIIINYIDNYPICTSIFIYVIFFCL